MKLIDSQVKLAIEKFGSLDAAIESEEIKNFYKDVDDMLLDLDVKGIDEIYAENPILLLLEAKHYTPEEYIKEFFLSGMDEYNALMEEYYAETVDRYSNKEEPFNAENYEKVLKVKWNRYILALNEFCNLQTSHVDAIIKDICKVPVDIAIGINDTYIVRFPEGEPDNDYIERCMAYMDRLPWLTILEKTDADESI